MSRAVDHVSAAEYRRRNGLPPPGADRRPPLVAQRGSSPDAFAGILAPDPERDERPRMNKTETAYALHLEGRRIDRQILAYWFEGISLRLARRTWYRPDFLVRMPDGRLEVHEVKGHWRDDARVKIKVAAELYPAFRFLAVRRSRRDWLVERF